jgi:hypothetical protein
MVFGQHLQLLIGTEYDTLQSATSTSYHLEQHIDGTTRTTLSDYYSIYSVGLLRGEIRGERRWNEQTRHSQSAATTYLVHATIIRLENT